MAPNVNEVADEMKKATLDPQIVERLGMIYGNHVLVETVYFISTNHYQTFLDGDLSITISMVIFIGLAVLAIFWARMYPENRCDPNKEFVVFLFDPKSDNLIARLGNEKSPNPSDNNNNPSQNIRNGNLFIVLNSISK